MSMTAAVRRIPPGPVESYDTSRELLDWMGEQFALFGDIFRASAFGTDIYAVRHPQYAQHVLRRNWQNYRKGTGVKRVAFLMGNGLVLSEGNHWKTQRKMIQPAFHRSAIGEFVRVITATNRELLDEWRLAAQKGEHVNVTRDVSTMVLKSVLLSIFGDDYQKIALEFSILSEDAGRDLHFAQEFWALRKLVGQIVTQRRADNVAASDFLGMLMEAREAESGQPMSDSRLISEIMTLVVAGHETTAGTLNWTWYLLSQHPSVDERLAKEVERLSDDSYYLHDLPRFSYTRQIIDETLRLYPAVWLMTRRVVSDDVLGDFFVPKGAEVYISPYFLQRHPALWSEPDRFCPDRFNTDLSRDRPELAMLPFGAGPRNCVGELFARVEMQIHLMMAASALRLRYACERPPEFDVGVNLRSKNDFIMRPEFRRMYGECAKDEEFA